MRIVLFLIMTIPFMCYGHILMGCDKVLDRSHPIATQRKVNYPIAKEVLIASLLQLSLAVLTILNDVQAVFGMQLWMYQQMRIERALLNTKEER